jgi:exopolysaccharide biosynthesis predicted pyruvyltransferase EpsI
MTSRETVPAAPAAPSPFDTVLGLRAKALDVLGEVLRGEDRGRPYALLDFPSYANAGDAAIWLGTSALLEALGFPPPAYTCDNRTFEPDVLARAVGDGPILLRGGGNFGDLFPKHQELRERVVREFPNNRIVQLPQSIHFESPEARDRAGRALAGHRALTVLVRDATSLERARDLGLSAALCPDLAAGLGPLPKREAPVRRIHWLTRKDHWRIHAAFPIADVPSSDWPKERTSVGGLHASWLASLIRRRRFRGLPLRRWLSRTYDPAARRRLARALELLGTAAVVVTDRLHGHILCLHTGTPHVLIDERTGKVRAYHDTWTRGAPGVVFADRIEDALDRAREMLRALPESGGRR